MFGNGKNLKKLRKGVVDTEKRKDFVIDDDAQFNVVEAFRKLKASLSVSIPKTGKGGVSIMVTSSYPEDGKTTVSVNIAKTFAMSSKARVVVVDTDIRKGRVAKFFKGKNKPGLSDYLSGQVSLDEVIKTVDGEETLNYIACGTVSPKPYELLESQAMKELDKQLRERYDYVIYDTSPALLVSDALAVAPVTDGAVVVCRHLRSYMSDLSKTINMLRFSKINVLGVVVNDFHRGVKKELGYKNYYEDGYYAYGDLKEEKDPNTQA
jgi:capsular exopolysaccharide synthesis family protein